MTYFIQRSEKRAFEGCVLFNIMLQLGNRSTHHHRSVILIAQIVILRLRLNNSALVLTSIIQPFDLAHLGPTQMAPSQRLQIHFYQLQQVQLIVSNLESGQVTCTINRTIKTPMQGVNKRDKLLQQEKEKFLKRPTQKITNLNSELKSSYESGYFKDKRFDHIRELRQIRKSGNDSVSSHGGTDDEDFDIKKETPERGRRRKVSEDSEKEKKPRKKPGRKPKVKPEPKEGEEETVDPPVKRGRGRPRGSGRSMRKGNAAAQSGRKEEPIEKKKPLQKEKTSKKKEESSQSSSEESSDSTEKMPKKKKILQPANKIKSNPKEQVKKKQTKIKKQSSDSSISQEEEQQSKAQKFNGIKARVVRKQMQNQELSSEENQKSQKSNKEKQEKSESSLKSTPKKQKPVESSPEKVAIAEQKPKKQIKTVQKQQDESTIKQDVISKEPIQQSKSQKSESPSEKKKTETVLPSPIEKREKVEKIKQKEKAISKQQNKSNSQDGEANQAKQVNETDQPVKIPKKRGRKSKAEIAMLLKLQEQNNQIKPQLSKEPSLEAEQNVIDKIQIQESKPSQQAIKTVSSKSNNKMDSQQKDNKSLASQTLVEKKIHSQQPEQPKINKQLVDLVKNGPFMDPQEIIRINPKLAAYIQALLMKRKMDRLAPNSKVVVESLIIFDSSKIMNKKPIFPKQRSNPPVTTIIVHSEEEKDTGIYSQSRRKSRYGDRHRKVRKIIIEQSPTESDLESDSEYYKPRIVRRVKRSRKQNYQKPNCEQIDQTEDYVVRKRPIKSEEKQTKEGVEAEQE